MSLALTVDGLAVNSVDIDIASVDLTPPIERSRTINVSDPRATVSATERGLPAGTYRVTLSASVVDDPSTPADESQIGCAGLVGGVEVSAGAITQVDDLVLLCTADGGQVRVAGGLTINAEVDSRSINQCPDLVEELSIAPLTTSVGGTVAIVTDLVDGAGITWSALAGTISVDGSQYTCPDIAGTYPLEALVTRGSCRERITQNVTCRSTYSGSCDPLATAFVVASDCGLSALCTVTQDGCAWQANCGGTIIGGEGEGSEYSFVFPDAPDASVCTGGLVDGELIGSCENSAGSCAFATDSNPDPVWACEALPRTITNVTTCGVTHESCDVVQSGCDFQAICDGGAVTVTGIVDDSTLQWDTVADGIRYRCRGPIEDGAVAGTCVQRGRGLENPLTCDDFAASVPARGGPSCEATLPSEGFVLEGCGLDGICFAFQRGCAWTVRCGTIEYGGVASETNGFAFSAPDGRQCTASVQDGQFTGSCQGEADSCAFGPVEREVDPSCLQLPQQLTSSGCDADFDCELLQDGCEIAASCDGGLAGVAGTVTATGITFPGIDALACSVELNAAGDLAGQCADAEGEVVCDDLVLSW